MKKIGMYMALAGIFAIVLNFMGRVPRILVWIYSWGDTVAWIIKIGLVIVGAALFFMGKNEETVAEVEEASETPEAEKE